MCALEKTFLKVDLLHILNYSHYTTKLLMYCNIVIDKKDEEKLQNINTLYEKGGCNVTENILLKCINCMYFYKLLHYTPLPKDVINIICDQLHDQIELTIRIYGFMGKDIKIDIGSTNDLSKWYATFRYYIYNNPDAQINENILQVVGTQKTVYSVIELQEWTNQIRQQKNKYEMVKKIIQNSINCNDSFYKDNVKYDIINCDKMLLICNIIYTIGKFIKKVNIEKN